MSMQQVGIQYHRPNYLWMRKAEGLIVGFPGVTEWKITPELETVEIDNAVMPQAAKLAYNVGQHRKAEIKMTGYTAAFMASAMGYSLGAGLTKIYVEELTVSAGAATLSAEPLEDPDDADNAMAITAVNMSEGGRPMEKVEAGDTPSKGQYTCDGTTWTGHEDNNDDSIRVIYMTRAESGGGSLTVSGTQPVIGPRMIWVGALAYLLENGPAPSSLNLSSGAQAGAFFAKFFVPDSVDKLIESADKQGSIVTIGGHINIIEPSTDFWVDYGLDSMAATS